MNVYECIGYKQETRRMAKQGAMDPTYGMLDDAYAARGAFNEMNSMKKPRGLETLPPIKDIQLSSSGSVARNAKEYAPKAPPKKKPATVPAYDDVMSTRMPKVKPVSNPSEAVASSVDDVASVTAKNTTSGAKGSASSFYNDAKAVGKKGFKSLKGFAKKNPYIALGIATGAGITTGILAGGGKKNSPVVVNNSR